MEHLFEPGDIVEPISGGPQRMVGSIDSDGTVRCEWCDKDGNQRHDTWQPTSLRKVKPKD